MARVNRAMIKFGAVFCVILHVLCVGRLNSTNAIKEYDRKDFPSGFIFGAGTSAYQAEGAAFEDGRTASLADEFAHGYMVGNGDVACDQYHKYKEDVQLMVDTGLEAYRFSISWSRLIPNGRGPVNPKGLEYYNNLINELVSHGIQPHVTLLHHDLPAVLEEEYGGFLNRKIVEDFTEYASVCFREFGDRVLHWSTINEANLFAKVIYGVWRGPSDGNSSTTSYDPYIIGDHTLLAHASAAKLYQKYFQARQHGSIGISLYTFLFIPFSNSTEDKLATQRSFAFFYDWFMHPLMYGDYPEMMKKILGSRLPIFTNSDSKLLRGSLDFVGLNHYTFIMAKNAPPCLNITATECDMKAIWIPADGNDILSGDSFANTPWALQGVLEHFKNAYNNPPIFIYENGELTNSSTTLVDDLSRMEYLRDHIGSVLDSLRNGSNVKGYFVWSFLDVFEFLFGYEKCFGLYFVDFDDNNLGRYPKLSQKWYSSFLKGRSNITAGIGSQENNVSTFLQMSPKEVNVGSIQ